MDNRLTDLSHPAVAAQSRNKTAIAGTCTMNTVCLLYTSSGPLFFAAADQILQINSDKATRVIVIRMRSVPAIDASAMKSLRELADRAKKKKITPVSYTHLE